MGMATEIEALLAYGATRRGCSMLRDRLGITTVPLLAEYVRGYREAKLGHPQRGYGFHVYLECDQIGAHSGARLLKAYERWEQVVRSKRQRQNDPDLVMV